MNTTTTSSTQARFPRDLDVDHAGYFRTQRVKHPLSRGCDLVTFGKLSASCDASMRRDETRLPDYPDGRAARTPLH
jgi:hypothetical protein